VNPTPETLPAVIGTSESFIFIYKGIEENKDQMHCDNEVSYKNTERKNITKRKET
jgi:hypothetical protein